MLENVASIFDGHTDMIMFKVGKKAAYKQQMQEFRDRCGHFFTEMTEYVEGKEEKETAAQEVADTFVEAVRVRFAGKGPFLKGRISGRKKLDLNFFLVYYVFPAILLTKHPDAELIVQKIKDTWNREMGEQITYTDYETIRGAFQEKIFGLIPIKSRDEDE